MTITFDHIYALWGLVLVPLLVIVLTIDGQLRRRILQRVVHTAQLGRIVGGISPTRWRLKATLFIAAIALLMVALAGPQIPGNARLLPRRGLDIVVALDFSRSMLASDVYPNRLERAKAELNRLIDGLSGDRVGLVAFAGVTLSYPLTNDYAAAKLFWRNLSADDIPVGGTDLGLALRDSLQLLEGGSRYSQRRSGKKSSQVIVLLTDGTDTEDGAQAAAREVAGRGVKLFTVGIGSAKGDYVVLEHNKNGTSEYVTDDNNQPMRMMLDAALLKQLATLTGGDYFEVDPGRFGVENVMRALANLERVEEESRVIREPIEIYAWFVLGAFLLLMLDLIIGDRRRAKPAATKTTSQPATVLLLAALLPGLAAFHFERPSPAIEEGNQLLKAGKSSEALQAYDRALKMFPGDPYAHFDRGAALFALGKHEEAQQEFERASKASDPALKADAFYNLGNTFMQENKPSEATEAYKNTLTLRPDDRQAKWNLELALRQVREQERQQKQQDNQQQNKPSSDKQQQEQQAQQQKEQQQKDQQQKEQQQKEQQQKEQQARQQKEQQEQQAQQQPSEQRSKEEQQRSENKAALRKQPLRDADKQDAESVLDAFEVVEPTVQKELARRRAGDRRPRKNW